MLRANFKDKIFHESTVGQKNMTNVNYLKYEKCKLYKIYVVIHVL